MGNSASLPLDTAAYRVVFFLYELEFLDGLSHVRDVSGGVSLFAPDFPNEEKESQETGACDSGRLLFGGTDFLQVHQFPVGEPDGRDSAVRRRDRRYFPEYSPARRNLVLYVSDAVVCHRRLSRGFRGGETLRLFCAVRIVFPPARGGAHRAPRQTTPPIERGAEVPKGILYGGNGIFIARIFP